MRKTFTLLIALMALCVSTWATTVTWDGTNLTSIQLEVSQGGFQAQTVNGITITADASTPGSYNYSYFGTDLTSNTSLQVIYDGSLTFAPVSGKLTQIVITCGNSTDANNINAAAGWEWDGNTQKLTWSGNAASSVVLKCAGSGLSFAFFEISSVVFTIAEDPVVPTPVYDQTITWDASQVNLVSLYPSTEKVSMGVINNIIASLERTDASNYCQFANGELWIQSNGELTFKSIVGDISQIIITCSDVYNDVYNALNISTGWTYDSSAKTLTWVGTPAEEVTISGNVDCMISSIEFFYQSAAAPRVGESFYDSWQWYEITGAHTAKVTAPRNLSGSVNIPASVVDNGVTYYITEIDDHAFYNYDQLSNASIGENVAKIGAHAFDGCSQMVEINVNSTVLESIGEAAFKNCLLLQYIDFYTDLPPVLGSGAFDGDNRLNHIHVHSSVVSRYKNSYYWSAHQAVIGALWSAPAIGEEFFFHNQMTTGIYAVSSVSPKEAKVLPYTVNAIYPITREGTLVIPEVVDYMSYGYNVTGIGANAYKDCSDIDMVMMPLAVKSIESGAFSGCTSVEKVFFLWDDPTTVTWADGSVGNDFKTAANGGTKIFVPKGRLNAYKTWAPAWANCMYEGKVMDVSATQDPDYHARYYRTFFGGSTAYMLPSGVWAHVGYVENGNLILQPIAFDGEVVPASTAVILESDKPSYRLIPVVESPQSIGARGAVYSVKNDLIGTDDDIERSSLGADADKVYVLNSQATIGGNLQVGMGMYRYTGTTLGANKAYLIYDAPSGPNNAPARFLFLHQDEATDVENVQENSVQCTKILRNGQLIIIIDGKEFNALGQIVK